MLLRLEGVSRSFGGVRAVDGCSKFEDFFLEFVYAGASQGGNRNRAHPIGERRVRKHGG